MKNDKSNAGDLNKQYTNRNSCVLNFAPSSTKSINHNLLSAFRCKLVVFYAVSYIL